MKKYFKLKKIYFRHFDATEQLESSQGKSLLKFIVGKSIFRGRRSLENHKIETAVKHVYYSFDAQSYQAKIENKYPIEFFAWLSLLG